MAETGDVAAIVVAAGSGTRFDAATAPRKQYRELAGVPLLRWAIQPFLDHPRIGATVVVLPPDDVESPPRWLAELPVVRVAGGAERGDSVWSGLEALSGESRRIVLIHDGARPLVSRELIDRVLGACDGCGVIPAVPVTDTVKEVDDSGLVVGTLDRRRYRRVQTPQAFPLDSIRYAYERARRDGVSMTDDAALFERCGYPVHVVDGDPTNLKVTTQVDLGHAEILARRLPPPGSNTPR